MAAKDRTPNLALRYFREHERHETRAEFADAMMRKAVELGEPVMPSERYVARLEDGDVRFPHPPYRRVLIALCGRQLADLGFGAAVTVGKEERKPEIYSKIPAADSPIYVPGVPLDEWSSWFGFRLARLLALIDGWSYQVTELGSFQSLLHDEITIFEDAISESSGEADYAAGMLARRQALVTLAALPAAFTGSGTDDRAGIRSEGALRESFLSRCAASITACWHLLRGSDLSAIDQVISGYLLPLEKTARQASRYQRVAADLASQANRISGIVALHRNKLRMREGYCKRALYYAGMGCDPGSQVSALISLASTYYYLSEPARAIAVYERAFALDAKMPHLQKSRVHAELSVVYGQVGREDDAIRSAQTAQDCYPQHPEHDPSFLYAEFTPASLALENGLAYLALAEQHPERGYERKSAATLEQFGHRSPTSEPDRIRYEIVNAQARACVLLNDLDAFESYACAGLDGAMRLQSQQRFREAEEAVRCASGRWPQERRLLAISERLQLARSGSDADMRRQIAAQ
jgi:tetratricopeptide (TPR) repeat protein